MARTHPLVIAASLGTACVVHAAVTTFEMQIPIRNGRVPIAIDLPQFDESLGSLERVEFVFEVGYSGVSRGENTSRFHGTEFVSQIVYDARLFSPGGMVIAHVGGTEEQRGSLDVFDGAFDYAGRSGYAIPFEGSDIVTWTTADPADLSTYIGPGTTSFTALATANTFSEGDIGILQSFETEAFIVISVRYNFAVPAPAAVAPLSIFVLARTRRR